jgi:hypothetical protein
MFVQSWTNIIIVVQYYTNIGQLFFATRVKSYTICALLTRSLGSIVVNKFIAHLWVLLINKMQVVCR